ncbi:MAG: amino acid ABC transporter substrate-binding protein [Flavobacterium sp.]|nr:amino acid ABC transporter substrate-binding protein [Pedobacter sp.]
MILVPNRLLQLNGNRVFVVLLVIFFSSCSKRILPVPESAPEKGQVKKQPVSKELPAITVRSMALILPFNLDKVNPANASATEISKSALAIDFYQGLKLALDSLSLEGTNFKLQVFDSRENELQIVNLARAQSVLNNDLIIGPIFPESIKTFSEFADLKEKLEVSPLAAADPRQFANPNLVTITNTIDQHAGKIADYINRNYKPDKVNLILINTLSNDDKKYADPFKNYLNQFSKNRFVINEKTNAIGLENYLSADKVNLVIIVSTDRDFILPSIDRLYKLSQGGIQIEVFGHPNWAKAQFLNSEKMQGLNTRITSSYFIDYKAGNVKQFVSRYRDEYGLEPKEFAFKGFDTGFYFGKLLAQYGSQYARYMSNSKYKGLHNRFQFVKVANSGYLNSELMILKYQGFELKVEE